MANIDSALGVTYFSTTNFKWLGSLSITRISLAKALSKTLLDDKPRFLFSMNEYEVVCNKLGLWLGGGKWPLAGFNGSTTIDEGVVDHHTKPKGSSSLSV